MKIITIVGARPQFIKAAALSREIGKRDEIKEILLHTGQHYDYAMSEIFFEEMGIPAPQYNLGIGGGSQGAMTGRMIEAIEEVLLKEKPQWTLVYGDTNSTLAGALAASKLNIPLIHVEAGLRSFNKKMPEEINRIVADHCGDLLFTPCTSATKQLLSEGIPPEKIVESGDITHEVALYYRQKAERESGILSQLTLDPQKYVLTTLHRQENTNDPCRMKEIWQGLHAIASHIPVIFPIHPRTKQVLQSLNLTKNQHHKIKFLEPLGYLDMIHLTANAHTVLTDSGGLQKEAYFFSVPCLTVRNETEWKELVENGYNQLVSAESSTIEKTFLSVSRNGKKWNSQIYGNGTTAQTIVQELIKRTP